MRLAERQVWRLVADRSRLSGEAVSAPDAEKSERVMKAMLQMKKIDLGALKRAHE